MQPIPARYYHNEAVFEQERAAIFHTQWQFVGMTHDLERHNDYVCVDVGAYSVIVQNFNGELRAFLNVCSHRFSQIRHDASGNGPLRCPYHGWAYNGEGVPTGIPSRPYFKDLKSKIPDLGLRRFQVATCGKFTFVRIADAGPTLEQELGPVAETLVAMSAGLDVRIDRTEWNIEANWKVVVENTLEAYHVGFVHPTTFKPMGLTGLDFRFDGPHSAYLGHVDDEQNMQVQKLRANFAQRRFQPDGYFHQFVFPNFLTSTSHGIVSSVQYHHAVAPGRTRMVSQLFHAAPAEDSRLRPAMLEVLYDSARVFNVTTLQEDQVICEGVQRGLRQTSRAGLLSDEEERLVAFRDAYMAALGATPAPAAGREIPVPMER
ncbi:MAG: hypothetical protein JWN79_1533 [Gemmatimonadetes bacterium]|jgi:phenylpropionate dioxygenase-like ring-hydroxylating dioxygenase large terminal subunit|nr:hypothetical protein [Gemmatimonadota bacterium]